MGDGVLLLDTGATAEDAKNLLAEVKKTVPDKPVRWVVMTHLHRDHVGWNLKTEGGKYVPTFPRARYWMPKKDWDSCHDPALQPTRWVNAPQCVWPLADLGPDAVGPGGPALKYYDSSGNEFIGFVYLAPVTLQMGSAQATTVLQRAGFNQVANLAGGMLRWHAAGLPVEGASDVDLD